MSISNRRQRQRFIFFGIVLGYAGIQWYALYVAYRVFALSSVWLVPLLSWLLLMTFFPFLLWRLEHIGQHRLATAGAWLGYGWMGTVFIFFWVSSLLDIGLRLLYGAQGVSAYHEFILALLLTLAIAAYGVLAAMRPRIEQVALHSKKLPAGHKPLRIALISDVHLGALVGKRALRRIVNRLTELNADILVSTGDLVDGQADRLNPLLPQLAALHPPLGKFAVIGNHECYAGLAHSLDFHERAGFKVLRATAVDVTPELSIAGVDDPAVASFGERLGLNERAALDAVDTSRFSLLLKHQPVLTAAGEPRADLQLSGHVHKGQIFPFNLLVRVVYPWPTGINKLPDDRYLYISRGTGTWGPPMRILAAPEITLLELSGV